MDQVIKRGKKGIRRAVEDLIKINNYNYHMNGSYVPRGAKIRKLSDVIRENAEIENVDEEGEDVEVQQVRKNIADEIAERQNKGLTTYKFKSIIQMYNIFYHFSIFLKIYIHSLIAVNLFLTIFNIN